VHRCDFADFAPGKIACEITDLADFDPTRNHPKPPDFAPPKSLPGVQRVAEIPRRGDRTGVHVHSALENARCPTVSGFWLYIGLRLFVRVHFSSEQTTVRFAPRPPPSCINLGAPTPQTRAMRIPRSPSQPHNHQNRSVTAPYLMRSEPPISRHPSASQETRRNPHLETSPDSKSQ
jgi:hypothetical protein